MYDKSLEQLIDAVIADGIITDQERKVVLKKATSLGIDQDEIEVYLDGRLDAFMNSGSSNSGKHGTIRTCPSCGAVVDSFAGKCSECGYSFVDIESNRTTKQLQEELEKIDKETPQSMLGNIFAIPGMNKNTNKKIQLIKNFTIPNTKADLIEFAMLCYTNLSTTPSTQTEMELRKAWSAKANQVESKANLLFPSDADVVSAVSQLSKERGSFFKAHRQGVIGFCSLLFCAIFFGSLFYFANQSEKETKVYSIEKIQEIENLPDPNKENYKECFRKFSSIHWTESTHSAGYRTFVEAQIAYRDLLISAYKEAGVVEDFIPESLLSIGRDQISTQNHTEVTIDSSGSTQEEQN